MKQFFFQEHDTPPKGSIEPGGIAVEIHNEKITCEHWGFANIEQRSPINEKTSFHFASIAKQFTAFLIAKHIISGKLQLNTLLVEHLDWLPTCMSSCTIQHALFHTSGIKDIWLLSEFAGLRDGDKILTNDAKNWLSKQTSLNFHEGSRFLYSNSGYILLALVLEKITDTSFVEIADKEIFVPLGMEDTQFVSNPNEIIADRAIGYKRQNGKWIISDPNYGVIGATCLRSNICDMKKWISAILQGSFFSDVNKACYFDRGKLDNGDMIKYGFGQIHLSIEKTNLIMHSGYDYGFNCSLIISKERNYALLSVSNASQVSIEQKSLNHALKKLTKYTPSTPNLKPKKQKKIPTGVYANNDFTDVRIIYDKPSGIQTLIWQQEIDLLPVSENTYKGESIPLEISINEQTNKTSLLIKSSLSSVKLSKIEERHNDLTTLCGKYFSNELDSTLIIFKKNSDFYIKIGRGKKYKINGINPHVLVWGCYWTIVKHNKNQSITLRVSHPRCTNILFEALNE